MASPSQAKQDLAGSPPGFTSYAQNFEDVILWRVLGHVRNGCYIDVGAQSPTVDSVSMGFYEKGWRGIHVEPSPAYAEELRQERPDEMVIEAAVDAIAREVVFFDVPGTGLSTTRPELAEQHAVAGFRVVERRVSSVTLDEVLAAAQGRIVHWLKIDVEGSEGVVLQGWTAAPDRPWVLVIESTLPMSQIGSHKDWEPLVLAKGYRFLYFDGLNRFYVADQHEELFSAFGPGPNVFDGFVLSGMASAPFCAKVNSRLRSMGEQLVVERQRAARRIEELQQDAALQLKSHMEQADALREAAAQQLEVERRATAQQLEVERRQATERVEALCTRLHGYRARLTASEARSEEQLAAHMVQVDRFQAHAQWLENEWAVAKARNDELNELAQQLRAHSERLDGELRAVLASTSWRLTAPVRGIKRTIAHVVMLPVALLSLPRRLRPLLEKAARFAVHGSRAKAWAPRVLKRFPLLEQRMRQSRLASAVATPDPPRVPAPIAATSLVGSTTTELSQRTSRVLVDLSRGTGTEH